MAEHTPKSDASTSVSPTSAVGLTNRAAAASEQLGGAHSGRRQRVMSSNGSPTHAAPFKTVLRQLLEEWWPRAADGSYKPLLKLDAKEVRNFRDKVVKTGKQLGPWFELNSWFVQQADRLFDLKEPNPPFGKTYDDKKLQNVVSSAEQALAGESDELERLRRLVSQR
jgi:hypothetical protein